MIGLLVAMAMSSEVLRIDVINLNRYIIGLRYSFMINNLVGALAGILVVGCSGESEVKSDKGAENFGGSPLAVRNDLKVGNKPSVPSSLSQCRACHTVDPNGRNGFGPRLFGVVGRKSGAEPGYSYSAVMAKAGLTWTPERLDQFIEAPSSIVPGTKMTFSGIKDSEERKSLVLYLETLQKY